MKRLTAIALTTAAALILGLQAAQAESQLGAFEPGKHVIKDARPVATTPVPRHSDPRLDGGRLSPADLQLGDSQPITGTVPAPTRDYATETLFGRLSPVADNLEG